MIESDSFYLDLAYEEARKALEEGEVPVGAVLVSEGTVIGRGHNKRNQLKEVLSHAECTCLLDASERSGLAIFPESTMYVTLEPCIMCTGALLNAHVARVVYGAPEPKFGALGSLIDLSLLQGLNVTLRKELVPDERVPLLMREFFKDKRGKNKTGSEE